MPRKNACEHARSTDFTTNQDEETTLVARYDALLYVATSGNRAARERRARLPYVRMATCPKCLGALTEHHKCPSRLLRRLTEAVSTVGVGSVVGAMFCFAIEEQPAGALVIAAAALGAVLAVAVRQAISSGRVS